MRLMMVTAQRSDRRERSLDQRWARAVLPAVVALIAAGCGADPSDAPIASPATASTASAETAASPDTTESTGTSTTDDTDDTDNTADTAAPSTTEFVPTTTEPKLPIPEGQLVAVPQQNREDPAKGQFQVQVVNGTRDRFEVTSVQFVWAGYTTPVTPRDTTVVGGQTIDFPVAFPGAVCVGDGLVDSMPSLDSAVVRLGLGDGSVREMPVVDQWHLARRLYLEDCQRQHIAASVTIEWADLHREDWEGRPVTAGVLRLTRGSSTGTITIDTISGTVPYSFETVDSVDGEPVVILPAGTSTIEVAIRFTESRCDPHALAEVKQPHKFVAQVDLGDRVLQPFVVTPDEADWIPMRRTADEACVVTGQVVFVGEETPTSSSAP